MQKDPSFPDAISGDDAVVEPTAAEKAAFFPAAHGDQPPKTPPAPPETASPDEPPSPRVPADLPSLDQMLKRLKQDARRGPGRPRKRRGAVQPELEGIALLTPEQRQARLTKIAEKLAAAEQQRDALEAQRGDVDVLDDAKLDAFHGDLARAEAACVTLCAAHATCAEAIRIAEANETMRAFEERARRTVADNAERYAADLQELHACVARIAELGPGLATARLALDEIGDRSRDRGRPDLVFDPETLREAVRRELGKPAPDTSPIEVERSGESDADWNARVLATLAARAAGRYLPDQGDDAKSSRDPARAARLRDARQMYVEPEDGEADDAYLKRLWTSVAQYLNVHRAESEPDADYAVRLREALARKMKLTRKAESDEAYRLRVANAHGLRQRAVERQDPLHETAAKAVPVIEAHCATADALRKARHRDRLRRLAEYGDRFERSPLDGRGVRSDDGERGVARLPGK